MDHNQFQEWLSGIDHLSPAQRQQTEAVFPGDTETAASLAAIEAAVGEDRQCSYCGTPGAISRGKARGLRRYQCKGCRKTFNAATGTPLSGLHRKDKWLSFCILSQDFGSVYELYAWTCDGGCEASPG